MTTSALSIGAWPTVRKSDDTAVPIYHRPGERRGKQIKGILMQADLFSFSPEAFPASLQVAPGSNEARKMCAGSGLKLSGCLGKSDPLGRFSRILLESETWASPEYFLTWRVKVTKCGCSVFQLAPSAPRTSGNGIGSWPTAAKRDEKGPNGQDHFDSRERPHMGQLPNTLKASWPTVTKEDQKTDESCLRIYADALKAGEKPPTTAQRLRAHVYASWPTPQEASMMSTRPNQNGGVKFRDVMPGTWATPRKADGEKGVRTPEGHAKERERRGGGCDLPTELSTWGTPQSMSPNPEAHNQINGQWYFPARGPLSSGCLARTEKFVERLTTLSAWLMGYTAAYLGRWETASCRRSRQKS